jgi:DNA polymerase III subunit delta'
MLGRAATRQMLGHAYLFLGPPSVGKTSLAMYLAGLLVCVGSGTKPCGICRGCKGVSRSSHPDVRTVERATDRRDITIDQIRHVELDLSMAPYESTRKLVCVSGAEAMNDAAASALLKTLEEPPAGATLVLAATDPGSLPSTIRSRCQIVSLQPVPAREIATALHADFAVDGERGAELASLARGRPGWAVRAIADPEMVEQERIMLQRIAGLREVGPYSRMLAIEAWLGKGTFLESRSRALDFLARLEAWWRDALILSQSASQPALARHVVAGSGGSGTLAAARIVAFLLSIQETAARVEANVTPRLALEHLLNEMPAATGVAHAKR